MSLILLGTNHKYSSIDFRENIFTSRKMREKLYLRFSNLRNFKGVVFIATCNRIELYADVEDKHIAINQIFRVFELEFELELGNYKNNFYIYQNKEVLKHLCFVASGIDSLILGETQILGQVKSFFSEAVKAGAVNRFFKEVFDSSLSVAQFIQKATAISKGKVSVGSVAVRFAEEKLNSLSGKNILIVGAGKVTELILKYLKKKESNIVFVANRTFNKAKKIAEKVQAKAIRFTDLERYIKKSDLMISATASPHFIFKKESLANLIEKNLLILDLAIPRDVEPDAANLENISLFTQENLELLIEKNMSKKEKEANKVKLIINKRVNLIWEKFIKLELEPVALP